MSTSMKTANDKKIGVGIIGLGRSGYGIHSKVLAEKELKDLFSINAVYDPIEERKLETAEEIAAAACDDIPALLGREDVELVIVASTNPFHAEHAVQALKAGKHVLCEKPFGLTTADVDAMMAAAEDSGTVLQPFQQRRYEPDFLKVKEIIDSGKLGDIKLIRICWHGFKRRWDWQTMTGMAGGALNNNGPHPIDHALELFGQGEPRVSCEMKRCLCSGDAEDYLKVVLTGDKNPTVEIELIDTVAFGQERWWVCGTAGGLKGDDSKLEWKWVDWSSMPERKVDPEPTSDRSYNGETLEWQYDSWTAGGQNNGGAGAAPAMQPAIDLYTGLFNTIKGISRQHITPESVRKRVEVLEKARQSAGRPLSPDVPGTRY